MTSSDLVRMGLRNLWRRKLRSILTILGVVIGTAAIVVMVSLGIGMNESFKSQLSQMGSLNVINVNTYYFPEGDGMIAISSRREQNKITDDVIAQIASIDGVEAVTPLLNSNVKFVSGRYVAYITLVGIDPDTMEAFDFKVEQGRLLTNEDKVDIVFGCDIHRQFWNLRSRMNRWMYSMDDEPVIDIMNSRLDMSFDMSFGEKYPGQSGRRPKSYRVNAAGLLVRSNNEKDWQAYINIHYLKQLLEQNRREQGNQGGRGGSSTDGYEEAMVKVKDIKDVERISKAINDMGYGTYSLADILKSMQETSKTLQTVLGGIGAISLLIAAIGITNTMIMSIYERTREIGIMKVLGCVIGDIRRLFLFEAGMIGTIGGLVGIGLSYGASYVLNKVGVSIMGRYGGPADYISVIPVWLAVAAIIFATAVGIVSGFYPALRATKISALEAIRTE